MKLRGVVLSTVYCVRTGNTPTLPAPVGVWTERDDELPAFMADMLMEPFASELVPTAIIA